MKGITAIFTALLLLLTVIPMGVSAATAPTTPVVYSITASPVDAVINEVVTYTVETDTTALVVRIKNIDGSIHTLANIDAGFANYVDNGNRRIWTLQKRVQIPYNAPRKAYASGNSGINSKSYATSEHFIVRMSTHTHPIAPWESEAGPPEEPEMGVVAGTFIQPWLCLDWTQERWNQELEKMNELNMHYLIIQYSSDMQFTGSGQDYTKYTLNSGAYSLYPSSLPEFVGKNNGNDQLKMCFEAAKKYDMQVIVGLNSDNRIWQYGFGMPELKSGETDYVTGSFFAGWVDLEADLSTRMMEEIWDLYGEDYGDQIYGWYFYPEIWNIDVACAGTDNGVYAQIWGRSLNTYLEMRDEITPTKPLLFSPFLNPDLSTPEQYGQFWKDIFEVANFKNFDIFSPQDSVGAKNIATSVMPLWMEQLYYSAQEEGLRFWVNNETFTLGYTPAPVSRLIEQIEGTLEYTEHNIVFSWNHYYSPLYQSNYQTYHDALLEYVNSKK